MVSYTHYTHPYSCFIPYLHCFLLLLNYIFLGKIWSRLLIVKTWFSKWPFKGQKYPPGVFCKKGVEIHRRFPVNFTKFLRTPFLQNTSGRMLRKQFRKTFYNPTSHVRHPKHTASRGSQIPYISHSKHSTSRTPNNLYQKHFVTWKNL